MSKIIEALQRPIRMRVEKGAFSEQEKLRTGSPRNQRHMTHEQLADVYFPGNGKAHEQLPAPTIIRVADPQRSFFVPWLITLLALGLSAFALFSTKRIAIDIRIIDDAGSAAAQTSAQTTLTPPAAYPIQPKVSVPPEAAILEPIASAELPEAITLSPLDFRFTGAAVLNSSRERSQITLANSTLSGLAYAVVDFDPPFQADRYALSFEARGSIGGEQIELIFKDVNGNSSLNWKNLMVFPEGLTTNWQPATIKLQRSDFFNPQVIRQLRIEIGSQRTGNESDAVIFLRSLQWLPLSMDANE